MTANYKSYMMLKASSNIYFSLTIYNSKQEFLQDCVGVVLPDLIDSAISKAKKTKPEQTAQI